MDTKPNILVFAGSARENSFNKMLARQAAVLAEQAGAHTTFIDLRDLPMPLFDQDLEEREGEHPNATVFKNYLKAADGLIIASPEHNGAYSALLKNAIDWASRKREGENALPCFSGKVAAIMSASPGGLGGLRGLVHIRTLLSNLGVIVLPDQTAIPSAHAAFNEDGSLKRDSDEKTVRSIVGMLVETTGKLNQ